MAAKPKLIALNAGLAIGLALVAWQGAATWKAAKEERRATVNVPVKHVTPPPMTPAKKPDNVQASKYADVAAKNLFSKDRNPTVIVDPPKVDPPKVMPPMPVVYGVLGLPSGVRAIMADHAGGQSKSVRAGDMIGDFKILALDLRTVKFEWDGRELDRNLDDLVDHSGPAAPAAAPSGPAAPPPPAAASNAPPTSAVFGPDISTPDGPARACKPGDNSALGTVVEGYKKAGVNTPFGLMGCRWEPNK